MTWPVTPDPAIHADVKGTNTPQPPFTSTQLLTWAENLPLAMIKEFANAILAALGLGGVIPTADNIITDVYNALLDIPQGNISGLTSSLEDILVTIIDALGGSSAGKDFQGLMAEASALLAPIGQTIGNLGSVVTSILMNLPVISTILQLLGLAPPPSSGSGGTGGTGTGTGTGSGTGAGTGTGAGSGTTLPADLTLAQLLGLLDTNTTISPSQLKALAPAASKNLLTDPGFNSGAVIQGNGQWCWDGWLGTGAFGGVNSSIRTVRPGLITIYNMVGTTQGVYMWGNEPINTGGNGQIMEYLRANTDGWLGDAIEWALTDTDQTYFEWINVPFPAAAYPMAPGIKAGYDWLINAINQIPGPFFFVMDSQGNQLGAAVYDELRFGSLQSRNNDFLGAIAAGNLRREEGHYFPGCPDLAPGTSGMCCVSLMTTGPYAGSGNPADPKIGNLIDTEDRWWDFAVPGDYFASTPVTGNTVDPGPDAIGGNVGDIAGISGELLRTFYKFVNFNNSNASVIENWLRWTAANGIFSGISIIEGFMGAPMNQINALGGANSPHMAYYKDVRPRASLGDQRTFLEIGTDYLNSFVGGVHPDGTPIAPPPVSGIRHQYALQRFPVQPYQVVTAGASAMWVNVVCEGPAIMVCVNAYDADGNLIATVTADECIISDPAVSSNWVFNPLKADFVMPDGAAEACLVLDVEPDAMQTGIVWFDDLIFEVDTLIDGAMINSPTLTGIPGEAVAGPQGQADILTAWQNMIDQFASSHSQTSVTGAKFSDMLQSVGSTALNAQLAYELGVAHQQVLGNVSTQPFWSGLQPTGQVTFPLPAGTLPAVSITPGTALGGFINASPAITVGFVEFMAKAASTPTGVYLNAYTVDPTTGNQTNVWASSDLSSEISTGSYAWVGVDITSAQPQFALSQWAYWEIVSQNDTISVVAQTMGQPNKLYQFPPNVGASRTTATSGGISPTTITPSQLGYGSTAPFVCMSVTDIAPMYQPPNVKAFSNGAGTYTYDIPSWAQVSGATFDLITIGGGGAGGDASGSAGFLGIGAWTRYGQGGTAGEWATKTLTYGADIPDGTTSFTVINGAGGIASGDGTPSMVGYNFTTAPSFDGAADGSHGHTTLISWDHTASAGAYVIVAICTGAATFDVTCGGTTMSPLGLVRNKADRSVTALYGMPNAPGGAQTIVVTIPRTDYVSGSSVSFKNVGAVAAVQSVDGATAALTQEVNCLSNQAIVQAFGQQGYAVLQSFTGGNHLSYGYNTNGTYHSMGLSLSYATASTTFAATGNVADDWGGIAVILQPVGTVLLSAPGGHGGGPSGSANFNPANPNTTSTGKGAPNQPWSGRNYPGSADTTLTHFPGNPPGGGSASGDLSFGAYPGADGATWIVAHQPATVAVTTGGGFGGGSELTVTYEATGTGGANVNNPNLSWQHTSSGGPTCGVVLFGSVEYSAGAANLTASYGSSTFTYQLGGLNFYNASGGAFYIFAIGLIGIPSGTQTVVLSATGATIGGLAGNTVSYQNVGSFGNFYGNNGLGTTLSLTGIPASPGSIVAVGFADGNAVITSPNQTQRWAQNSTTSIPMLICDASGATTESFTASMSRSEYWGEVGGLILPPS